MAASSHDGRAEAVAEGLGKLVGLLATVDVDGLTGGVYDHFAVVAGSEVLFDFSKEVGFDPSVEEVG